MGTLCGSHVAAERVCKREGALEKARGLYGLKALSGKGRLQVARGGREEAAGHAATSLASVGQTVGRGWPRTQVGPVWREPSSGVKG